jgi:hypothetical protein
MKAVVRDAYGSVDVLRLGEVDKPVAGEAEVLVRVHAAGVDAGVWHLMAGMPYVMRLGGFGLRAPKNPFLGYDVAGRVEAVGGQVTVFRPGEDVFGTCRGSFAEYAVARTDRLASKPDNLGFEEAAAVPISGYAALQAVRDHGKVSTGQRVLIIGAGGGVGTFAVQIANPRHRRQPLALTASTSAGAAGDACDRWRRRRRQMAGSPPPARGLGALPVRRSEARHVHLEGARSGPGGAEKAARSWCDQARRRQDISSRRGSRGDPLPERRPRARQDRHQRLTYELRPPKARYD